MVTDLTTTPNGCYGELDGKKSHQISPLEESYRKNDIKIFTDTKIIEKYKSKNKPSINKFEFILTEFDRNSDSINSKIDGEFGEKKPDVTRIVFNKNWARDFYPFTRWILAHRAFHAIQLSRAMTTFSFPLFDDFIKKIELEKFGNNISIFDKETDLSIRSSRTEEEIVKIKFIRSLFKFRSARQAKRLINIDLYAELFAQYQIVGEVTFNRTDSNEVNLLLEEFEPVINSEFDDICRKINCGTYVF